MTREFKNPPKSGLPRYVTEKMVNRWKSQKSALEAHQSASSWLYFSEWPGFLTGDNDESTTRTAEEITRDQREPILRDSGHTIKVDIPVLWVKKEHLKDLIKLLKESEEFQYNFLVDLTSVDFLNSPLKEDNEKNQGKRFQVVYMLRSIADYSMKIRVVVPVDENEEVDSISEIFAGANWPEREVYDLMGIRFSGHPQLERILMPENYRGHPLRKDFPLQGIGEDYLIDDLLKEHLLED